MGKFLLITFLLCQVSFGQQRFFIKKGETLLFYNGSEFTTVGTGISEICYPYVMKGTRLYYFDRSTYTLKYVAEGVSRILYGLYLKGDVLYALNGTTSTILAYGVTEVFNSCSDPYKPGTYRDPADRPF